MKRTPRHVLVTAFEPFGGRTVNRSATVLEQVRRSVAARRGERRIRVTGRVLPVSFRALPSALERVLAAGPDAVLLLGEAASADELRLERVAVNRIDARIPDNDGARPTGVPVVDGGPSAYFTPVALDATLDAVAATGAPVRISGDAGTFACNAAYYLALHARAVDGLERPVLFAHVPTRSRVIALRPLVRAVLAVVDALGAAANEAPPRARPRRLRRRSTR